jgi:hypothetical protein
MLNKIRQQLTYLRQRQNATLQDAPHTLFLNPSNELEQDEPWPRFKFDWKHEQHLNKNKHYV